MAATFGGDDVAALVIDVGSSWTKAGYAGQDCPEAYFSSSVGYRHDVPDSSNDTKRTQWITGDTSRAIDTSKVSYRNPLQSGIVHDWAAYECVLDCAINKYLRVKSSEHPVLLIEPAWNPRDVRRQVMETVFENFNCPAFSFLKSPTATAFAAGHHAGLIIECGASTTSVCAVYDGYVLQKSIFRQNFAGNALSKLTRSLYGKHHGSDIHPSYMIAKKKKVPLGAMCDAIFRPNVDPTSAFHDSCIMRHIDDLKETCFSVSETPLNMANLSGANSSPIVYEFPCGYSTSISDLCGIPEMLFQPSEYPFPHETIKNEIFTDGSKPMGIPEMIFNCMQFVDVDVKPLLLSNIMISGGTTNFPGFAERVSKHLQHMFSGCKVKVCTPTTLPEKKFAPWLGGSILGSLGSFQSLWISRKEYDEVGKHIVDVKANY